MAAEIYKNKRNPVLPARYHMPDGEAHVMPDGSLYVYGSWDDLSDTYGSDRYHVVSTENMEDWTVHDIALNGGRIYWFDNPQYPVCQGIDWEHPTPFIRKMLEESEKSEDGHSGKSVAEKRPLLYAPDCVEKDGIYYLYFCMVDNSEGVAVSDRPEGPFEHPVKLACAGIDPAVFKDDDGEVYYYWGQLSLCGVRLNPDMRTFEESMVVKGIVTEQEHCFHEGASVRKIGDTYYCVYADMERGRPTALGYATSKSPLGPYVYRGIIIDNQKCDPQSWNNHGSIECVNGQWYVFYHRSSRGSKLYRRLCIEPITINSDGSIAEVKMTSQGAGAPFTPGEIIESWRACELGGTVFIGRGKTGGEMLVNISDGDSAVFRYVSSKKGFIGISIKACGRGNIEVLLNGNKAGQVNCAGDGEKEGTEERMYESALSVLQGEYELKLVFKNTEHLEIAELIMR